jgi:hypothetical protein
LVTGGPAGGAEEGVRAVHEAHANSTGTVSERMETIGGSRQPERAMAPPERVAVAFNLHEEKSVCRCLY